MNINFELHYLFKSMRGPGPKEFLEAQDIIMTHTWTSNVKRKDQDIKPSWINPSYMYIIVLNSWSIPPIDAS
jgi:hypothetical protein